MVAGSRPIDAHSAATRSTCSGSGRPGWSAGPATVIHASAIRATSPRVFGPPAATASGRRGRCTQPGSIIASSTV
jgi:hypothetical protein